ncbi:MAG: hypothetical protein OXF01_02300 [Gemmatimonadetes bacterium]|nr:hypothetical protein [Gemmatimonadota bacterium]
MSLAEPEELCLEVLPLYRAALDGADKGDSRAAAEGALEAYETAEWNGEVAEVAEEFLEGFFDAIRAVPDPVRLLGCFFDACQDAIETERSVWLPDRSAVARACESAISTAVGPLELANTAYDGLQTALRRSEQSELVYAALCRALGNLLKHDPEAIVHVLLQAIGHVAHREPLPVLFAGFSKCQRTMPADTAAALFDALMEVIELDDDCAADLVYELLSDARRAIGEADDPRAATAVMLESVCRALPSGPGPPSWMFPNAPALTPFHRMAERVGQLEQEVLSLRQKNGELAVHVRCLEEEVEDLRKANRALRRDEEGCQAEVPPPRWDGTGHNDE